MANNFLADSDCYAVWNMESGALTTDSKGSNTLTDNNTVGEDTTNYKQGSCSADFEADNDESLGIADANLDSGFPFKNGDTQKIFSACCWIRAESHGISGYEYVWSKYNTVGQDRTIALYENANGRLVLAQGYNDGENYDYDTHASALTDGRWYHVGVTYDGSDDSYRIRIWDDYNSQILGTDLTGTFANAISVRGADFVIGARGDYDTDRNWDGNIDELVIFDKELTTSEIDEIRQGIYGPSGPMPKPIAQYRRRRT